MHFIKGKHAFYYSHYKLFSKHTILGCIFVFDLILIQWTSRCNHYPTHCLSHVKEKCVGKQMWSKILIWALCQSLNLHWIFSYLELSRGKCSISLILIPEKQTTDFHVSFQDYLESYFTVGITVPIEMCSLMLKCQKMASQSFITVQVNVNTNIAMTTIFQHLGGWKAHTVSLPVYILQTGNIYNYITLIN